MFVDASVIVAILNQEPGFEELVKLLEKSSAFHVSPLVRFEAVAALVRIRLEATNWKADRQAVFTEARALVEGVIQALDAQQLDIDERTGEAALDAMARYGKLAGHVAALNFGDCFVYATAKSHGLKLAYKGNDFVHTDMA